MAEETYSTQRLDHLGIVAGICQQIGLVEQIDTYVGSTERKVSVGEAVQAMVLNALGFVESALYLTPEFFDNKPVGLLIREGLTAEDLNDDSLGRALDMLYKADITQVFFCVAYHALNVFEIGHDSDSPVVGSPTFVHLDNTTFSLEGDYAIPSEDPRAVRIAHGYSRDHRPDLKQVVVSLICSYQSSIPVWLQALDGNRVDKESFPKIIQAYVSQMQASDSRELPYFIADSALYSEKNIKSLSQVKWITRIPGTLNEVKKLYKSITPEQMQESALEGYSYLEVGNYYGGLPQRWLVVFSKAAYKRESATFRKRLAEKRTQGEKSLKQLSQQEFPTQKAAKTAVRGLESQWTFHQATIVKLEKIFRYKRAGRPGKGEKPEHVGWRVVGEVVDNEEAIAQALKSKGKFILGSNELDEEQLPAQMILTAYKGQAASVERGFRFLKDPMFFASSLFLEKPERIMALLMVMGLSLLVYALAERSLRTELAQRDESIPNQVGKLTQRPTIRRIFQVFRGIDILLIKNHLGIQRQVLNLKPIHLRVLDLLGPEVKKYYILDG
jgi:transposase